MRRLALFGLIGIAVVLLAGWLLLRWATAGTLQEFLLQQLAQQIGEDVTVDTLDLQLSAPQIVLSGLKVGGPLLLGIGTAELGIDIATTLRQRRISLATAIRDLHVETAGPADETVDVEADPSPLWLPPIDLVAEIDGARVEMSDDRSITLQRFAAVLAVDSGSSMGGQVSTAGVTLLDRGRSTEIDRGSADVRWKDGSLFVQQLSLKGPELRVEAHPVAAAEAPGAGGGIAATAVRASGQIGPIIEFFAGEVEISGQASIDLEIDGALADPELRGVIRLDQADLFGADFTTLALDVRRTSGEWRGTVIEAVWPGGDLAADLKLDESGGMLSGDLRWDDVDAAALVAAGDQWRSQSSGTATFAVNLDEFHLSADGQGEISARGTQAIRFEVAMTMDDDDRIAGTAQLAIDAANWASIRLDRADEDGLAAEIAVEIAAAELVVAALGYVGQPPLQGGLSAAATLSGTMTDPRADLRVAGADLRLADGTVVELHSQATLSPSEGVFENVSLAIGSGRLDAQGRVAFAVGASNDWTLRADALELAPIFGALRATIAPSAPRFEGRLDGSLDVDGPWNSLQAIGRFAVADARAEEIALGRLRIALVSDAGEWRADASLAAGEAPGNAAIEVRGTGSSVFAVEGFVRQWPVGALLRDDDAEVAGSVSIEGKVQAIPLGARGTIVASLDDLVVGERPIGNSTVRAVGEDGPWRVDGDLLGETVRLEGRVETGDGAPFTARLHWRDAVLPAFLLGGDDLRTTLTGEMTAAGHLTDLGATDATLTLESVEFAAGRDRLANEGPIRVELVGGDLRLLSLVLVGGKTRLTAVGSRVADGGSRLRVDGTLALGWLEHLSPTLEAAYGTAELAVEVVGSGDGAPQLSGVASIRDGGFEVSGVPPATGVRGDIALSSTEIGTRSLEGDIGGGRFSLAGVIDLVDGPALDWSVRNVSLEPVDRLELVVTGKGDLRGAWDKTVLSGDVTIGDLLYDRNLEFQDLIPSFERALAPAPARRDQRPPLLLKMRVSARDGMYVENNMADLEARTDLEITGSARRPLVRGAIEVIDGRVLLRGRSFEIITGALRFEPELLGKAYIDFIAESIIDSGEVPYAVQVRVTGTTDDYRVALASEDGLSQTDIASLITFGKTVSEMQEGGGAGGGLSMDALAGLAGGQVGRVLAGEVRDVLRFDEVELRPGFSPMTGEFEPQLRVGKNLAEDLTAWISQTFGVRSQTAFEMDYALTRQIAATLRWESQTSSQEGAFGGELSQRFQFWGMPKWLRWGAPCEGDGD